MRQVVSILLALLFGVGPLTAALPASEDARLPACCRRNGAHHCAMSAQMAAQMARTATSQSDGRTALSAPATCPYYPGAIVALIFPPHALLAPALDLPFLQSSTRVVDGGGVSARPVPPRTHAGRGPPARSFS